MARLSQLGRAAAGARGAAYLVLAALLLVAIASLATCAAAQDFTVTDSRAWSSSGSPEVYPGSSRVRLRIEARYSGASPASSVYGHLSTVDGISFSLGSGPTTPAEPPDVQAGGYVVFEYYLDLSKSLQPGTYGLSFNITYIADAAPRTAGPFDIPLSVSSYPEAQLKVLDAYLSPASYPGSVGTGLYVVLENAGGSSIASASFTLEPPQGFLVESPRTTVGTVGKGERFTVSFRGVSVPQGAGRGQYEATLRMSASMRTDDGVAYSSQASVTISFAVTDPPPELPLVLSSVSVLYQGSPAPLLPSARGVTVRITLLNRLPDPIGGMVVAHSVDGGIVVRSTSGTYVNGAPSGSSCFIDLVVDVPPGASLGRHRIHLNVSYVRVVEGASYMAHQELSTEVSVESHHSYVPELSLASAYWGSPDPAPVYGGSRYAPLTIQLVNNGRYDALGVAVEASSQQLRPVKGSEAVAARLAPGSYASATLYFDVAAGAKSAIVNVLVNYTFSEFGAHVNVSRKFTTHLPIEEYPAASSSLMVVSSGWARGYSVFPRTENATYEVVISNRAPFSVGGVLLLLELPANMSSSSGRVARAYVEGPIRSLDTLTATFTITVGDVRPGRYEAALTVDFILHSGGPGVRCVETFSVPMVVSDDSQAVEVLSSSWYEGSVGPGTYGAHLIVVVRNNYVDSMKGPVLELHLPPGVVSAVDNSSCVRAPPLSITPAQLAQLMYPQRPAPSLGPLIGPAQAGAPQAFSRGDAITFLASVHILNASPGVLSVDGAVSYVDQWGSRRAVRVSVPVSILGRVEYLQVSMSGSVSVRSRFTNATLTIRNVGTSPLYDVYLAIYPYQGAAPLLMATPAVSYIKAVGAGGVVEVPVTLAYSPLLSVATPVTYGPVPLMVSAVYRDASGSLRSMNNSIVVVVEPFVDLLVKDVTAVGRPASSTVTGTVVNYGSAVAYRARAVFEVGGESRTVLIGDVAPGDEMTFKITVPRYGESGVLRVEYYNIFNELCSRELPISIELAAEAPAAPAPSPGMGIEAWAVVGAVVAFLSVAALLIRKALRPGRAGGGGPSWPSTPSS
ncbi:MAG: hypothetical protein QXT74_05350 [Candidatus Nezhaarchaeales archaeon]